MGNYFKILKKNKEIFLKTGCSILLSVITLTILQRVFFPTFKGEFIILISDPFQNTNSNQLSKQLGDLNINKTNSSNDIPTLIEILKSPSVLMPIAKANGITLKNLNKKLDIKTGGILRKEAKGILKISVTSNKKEKAQNLINSIEKSYFQVEDKYKELNAIKKYESMETNELANALNYYKSNSQIVLGIKNRQLNIKPSTRKEIINAIKKSQAQLDWELIQEPYVDEDPISPKESLNLIFGIFVSFLGGIIAIIINEKQY